MRRLTTILAAVAAVACFTAAAGADVKLPAVIGDNMVLQQGVEAPIWGWAAPGEKVTVKFGSDSKTATAGEDGKWMVKLSPMKAGGPLEMTIAGANSITLKNILVGEVWVASGQSNMHMAVSSAKDAEQEIAAANYPKIRLITVPNVTAETPQADFDGKWVECSPETVKNFSAAAYFFGRDLAKDLDVPIGIIHTSWSGSIAEAWMSSGSLEAHADTLKPLLDHWQDLDAKWDAAAADAAYKTRLDEWQKAADAASAAGARAPRRPRQPEPPMLDMNHPSVLYNAMIAPLIPYAMRGVIWYQGEGNSGRAFQYRTLFPALIEDWRAKWGEGDFPFLYVQLANYRATQPEPVESTWAELREVQLKTLSLPNTGMAVIIDVGDAGNVHPTDKQTVGYRLALAARALVYGEKIVYSGPIYDSYSVGGGEVTIKFKHVGSGLVAKGDKLTGFQIAGEDREFVWADARIDGDTVVVSSPSVARPVSVRYAWQDNPVANLYNEEGLPASPFRTDDWPGITMDEQWP